MAQNFEKVRPIENFHIVLWLIKDVCWVADFKWMGMLMIVPALVVAIYITYMWWSSYAERMHNLAVCAWLCANSVWMTGEFFFNDTLRPLAVMFFGLGLVFVAWYYSSKWIADIRR